MTFKLDFQTRIANKKYRAPRWHRWI